MFAGRVHLIKSQEPCKHQHAVPRLWKPVAATDRVHAHASEHGTDKLLHCGSSIDSVAVLTEHKVPYEGGQWLDWLSLSAAHIVGNQLLFIHIADDLQDPSVAQPCAKASSTQMT